MMAWILPGLVMGSAAEKERMDYQKKVCEQTATLQKNYAEFYDSSVAYIRSQTAQSKAMQENINRLSANVTQNTLKLGEMQKNFKVSMAILNIGLLLSILMVAVMLYMKHKGILSLNPIGE